MICTIQTDTGKKFKSRSDYLSFLQSSDANSRDWFSTCLLSDMEYSTVKRQPNINLHTAAKNRLLQLRKSFKHINFWFSGGADSNFVLENMIRHTIFPDEITVLRWSPFNTVEFYAHDFESNQAINKIKDYTDRKLLPPHIKLSILDFSAKDTERLILTPEVMYEHVAQGHGIVNVPASFEFRTEQENIDMYNAGYCSLYGGNTPHVTWSDQNQCYQFYFTDLQFGAQIKHQNRAHVNFVVDDYDMMTAYANNVVDLVSKFDASEIIFGTEKTHPNRIRDLLPAFYSTTLSKVECLSKFPLSQYMDRLPLGPILPKELSDRVNTSGKAWIMKTLGEKYHTRWYELYLEHSRWDLIASSLKLGGILTKKILIV